MRARTLVPWVAFEVALGLASGCAASSRESQRLHQKDQELRALQEESSRRAGALESSQKAVESLREELRALTAEKGRLSEELARRQTELEYHEEKAQALQRSQRSLQAELTGSHARLLELRRDVMLVSRRLEHATESVQRSEDATRIPQWILAEGVPEIRVSVKTVEAVHQELLDARSALEPLAATLREAAGDPAALAGGPDGLDPDIEVVEATMLNPLVPAATSDGAERRGLGEDHGSLGPPGEAAGRGTFVSQLFGLVRHHLLRLFESGRKWDAGDYGFLGVLLLSAVLLGLVVLVPFRWALQRPKERELALLRRVVAAGAGGGDVPYRVHETRDEVADRTPEGQEEPEPCTVIVDSEEPGIEETGEAQLAAEVEEPPELDEPAPARPIEASAPRREDHRGSAGDEPVPCGPPERFEADPLELASTQEMDRLADDDLERTRELSRELQEGEATPRSETLPEEATAGREEEALDDGVSDEIAHALDAALPQEKASPAPAEAKPAPSLGERRSFGETQGLDVPSPEEATRTQEMPRLDRSEAVPIRQRRAPAREEPQSTQGMAREALDDGGTTQPLERLAREDLDSTRELDPRARDQFRTTQRVGRESGEEPSSTQEVRRRRLEEHQARSEKRREVEFRSTQDVTVPPPRRPRPSPPRGDETAPLPGLITTEYAATQPLPELLFRSPEPKPAAPPSEESRGASPPPGAPRERQEPPAEDGEDRSLLSQLERLMGRKIERERG